MSAQGWFRDPFEAHELRWFSDGVPTDLVRDDDVESFDIPSSPTWDPPVPARGTDVEDGSDLRRADEPTPPRIPYPASTLRLVALVVLGVPLVFVLIYLRLEWWSYSP